MAVGILGYGGFIPKLRLNRASVVAANGWFNPAVKAYGAGERSIASWDEDAITLAVEAARGCLGDRDRNAVDAVVMASTSYPFDDRQNAGIAAQALNLRRDIAVMDLAASQRAGTAALLSALATGNRTSLVLAAEKRKTRVASVQELTYGDGAAAFLVGEGTGQVATLVAAHSESVDFVDHYRARGRDFDYSWEERWIREEGYFEIVPGAVRRLFEKSGVDPGSISHFCVPTALSRVADAIAKQLGISEKAVRDNLQSVCGETGAAHPLVMLAHALDDARPGDRILVTSFGQGCDAMIIEATEALPAARPARSVGAALARRQSVTNYLRYLSFNDLVSMDRGLRSEVDKQTSMTTLYRKRAMLIGLVGGRCTKCGVQQFPKSSMCVSPACNAIGTQVDQPFADLEGRVNSFTADSLTYTPDPPLYYGMVQFASGGRIMVEFADVTAEQLSVGMTMRMMFRIKDHDHQRGFTRYFWKATPIAAATE